MAAFEDRSTDPSATFIEMPHLVDENSRLSKALSLHPDVLDYIVSLNPHDFQRLHNPLMRRLMPPRISLKRVAKITNRPVVDILARIHEIAGQPLSEEDRKKIAARAGLTAPDDEAPIQEPPEWTNKEPREVVDPACLRRAFGLRPYGSDPAGTQAVRSGGVHFNQAQVGAAASLRHLG